MRNDRLNTSSGSYAGANVKVAKATVSASSLVDGGSAEGTLDTGVVLPKGSIALYSFIDVVTGYTGDTSCVVDIGDGTDVDRYTAGTAENIFAAGDIDGGMPQGIKWHDAAKNITLTVTSGSDIGLVIATAGLIHIYVVYIDTAVSVSF